MLLDLIMGFRDAPTNSEHWFINVVLGFFLTAHPENYELLYSVYRSFQSLPHLLIQSATKTKYSSVPTAVNPSDISLSVAVETLVNSFFHHLFQITKLCHCPNEK